MYEYTYLQVQHDAMQLTTTEPRRRTVIHSTDIYGVWGTFAKSLNSLQTLFTDFDCINDQNFKISHNSPPDSRPVCFTVGLSDIFGGRSAA